MANSSEDKRPIETIRLGAIKANVWANENGNGVMYNVKFSRIYRLSEEQRGEGDDGWREAKSFGRDDLLKLGKVADLAHTFCYEQNGRKDSE